MAGEEIAPRAADQALSGQVVSSGKTSQAELMAQLEQSRLELGRTVDAIADKVKPANVARRATDQLRQRVATIDPKLVGAGVAVVAGLVTLVVWRRHRKR